MVYLNYDNECKKGIMEHEEARKRHTGGKLLGFFYWATKAIKSNKILKFVSNKIIMNKIAWFLVKWIIKY